MRKKLVTLGMAGLMTAMSVVPAFAGQTDRTTENWDAEGTAKAAFEALDYNEDSVEDADYWEELKGDFGGETGDAQTKSTEVGVQQGMSYMVTIPSFISLNGEKDAADGNMAKFYVAVSGDVGGKSEITVVPKLLEKALEGVANGTTYSEYDKDAGLGTFPLKEKASIKKDIVATINYIDVDWNMDSDGREDDGIQSLGKDFASADLSAKETALADFSAFDSITDLKGAHVGTVTVDKLSAGTFMNTIDFNVSFTNDRVVSETTD